MAISTTMDIYGVKQAIATLKEIDPEYRKEMLKQVKIILKSGSTRIETTGVALNNGYTNSKIRVRESNNNTIIEGIVIDKDTVQVEIK